MTRVTWRSAAREDRAAIMDYIAENNPLAALELDELIEDRTNSLIDHPRLYKPGRVKGTREMVIHANYVVVYQENSRARTVTILRVLHTARQYPSHP